MHFSKLTLFDLLAHQIQRQHPTPGSGNPCTDGAHWGKWVASQDESICKEILGGKSDLPSSPRLPCPCPGQKRAGGGGRLQVANAPHTSPQWPIHHFCQVLHMYNHWGEAGVGCIHEDGAPEVKALGMGGFPLSHWKCPHTAFSLHQLVLWSSPYESFVFLRLGMWAVPPDEDRKGVKGGGMGGRE